MNETLKYVYLTTTNVQILRNEFMFRELTDTCWIRMFPANLRYEIVFKTKAMNSHNFIACLSACRYFFISVQRPLQI